MSKAYLLDTNIIIALFKREQTVIKRLSGKQLAFVPSIALGELFYGAEKSKERAENVSRIETFAKASPILNCDIETARNYGRIHHQLRANGTPIPDNDIWIAAIAFQYQLIVVSRDKHFEHIKELELEKW